MASITTNERSGQNTSCSDRRLRLNTRPLIKLLEEHQPDITVCTHFMPAEIISWLVREKKLATRQAIVVTDFDIHVQWLCPSPAHYFVAIDELAPISKPWAFRLQPSRFRGIRSTPCSASRRTRLAIRDKHGLRRDAIVILISAGGFGIGQVEEVLASLLQLRHPAEIIAVCGRNEELKARVDRLAGDVPAASRVTLEVVGYTTAMDEYMTASDFVAGNRVGRRCPKPWRAARCS